jgi:Ner family transcriptional regulator
MKSNQGWHPEDIKAAIRKTRVTLTQLALENGLPEASCRVALTRPRYWAEQVIAAYLDIPPFELWPHRYTRNGGLPDWRLRHPAIRNSNPAAPGRYRENRTARAHRLRKKATPAADQDSSQKRDAA